LVGTAAPNQAAAPFSIPSTVDKGLLLDGDEDRFDDALVGLVGVEYFCGSCCCSRATLLLSVNMEA